ncbi:uncharacterized protein PV09_05222 [Verruconis gallopava]|uniref:C2H2-type domain-containing protein n=1 Tax=Verruconis gallopava TaxID=253628 RepID=A0A0D1YS54_9PEZI|nr:uncharacterized protein PV09_05222 [Verruconis gallopava]KIW03452.1 hypothetical protein PV09_05222 [Verruconis gallopava]
MCGRWTAGLSSDQTSGFGNNHDPSPSPTAGLHKGSCDCRYPFCGQRFSLRDDLEAHFCAAHPCQECGLSCSSISDLDHHVGGSGHTCYVCPYDGCSKVYSAHTSLLRHVKTQHEDLPGFPCIYCKKYRGKDAFKRKDHLAQHLRNYHHIGEKESGARLSCPHDGCDKFRADAFKTFGNTWSPRWNFHHTMTRKEFMAHMRKVHSESPFQCSVAGCNRRGGKGYFRFRDLDKHRRKDHPDLFTEPADNDEARLQSTPFYFHSFLPFQP